MKTIPFAEKQTVIILAPFIKAFPIDIKLMINKIWIKLPGLACFNVLFRWLTSIVFCFLKFLTFLHIVCFKILI